MATDWLANKDKIYAYTDGGKGILVATVWAAPVSTNAQIMAAAPAMYVALEDLLARRSERTIDAAKLALRKASGTL
jgi:CRP-like cAMP-binding protein